MASLGPFRGGSASPNPSQESQREREWDHQQRGGQKAGEAPQQQKTTSRKPCCLVGAIGLDAVYTHLAAALTSLQLDDPEGDYERGRPSPPPPNAFEIAALVAGVMDEAAEQPTPGKLLEVLELVQAADLAGSSSEATIGKITHWAEDAAEEAEALLHTLITEGGARQGGSLANLRQPAPRGGGVPTRRGSRSASTHHTPGRRARTARGSAQTRGKRSHQTPDTSTQPTQDYDGWCHSWCGTC